MSVKKEMRTYQPRPSEEITETVCDLCKDSVPHDVDDMDSWKSEVYDINNVTMRHRGGSRYPESTDFFESVFDICPQCWTDKIVPFMKSLGAEPRTEEMNW